MTTDITELAQREKFEAWGITQICISKSTMEGLRTADGYRNTTLSGTDYNHMWNCWKAASAELVEALEKAQQAININNQWKPDACPITGRRFFLWIEHPELGYVPTYGGPYDSYTIPARDSDGEFSCERYDHDFGGWVDGECVGAYLVDDDELCRVYELEQRIAELESRTFTVKLPDYADNGVGETWDDGFNSGIDSTCDAFRSALTAAGIKVEAE